MAAETLVRMGAGANAPGWAAAYRSRSGPAPEASQTITDEEWRAHLGDERRTGDWMALHR